MQIQSRKARKARTARKAHIQQIIPLNSPIITQLSCTNMEDNSQKHPRDWADPAEGKRAVPAFPFDCQIFLQV